MEVAGAAPARGLGRHEYAVLALTFASYASFHASRKSPSIVKAVLSADWDPSRAPGACTASVSSASPSSPPTRLPCSPRATSLTVSTSTAYFLDVHALAFFVAAQVASGVVQSIGWPCVVAVVGNWFGHASKRGTIMGVWNSHTSVGNIAGSVLAAAVLEFGWGWSFLVPAVVIAALGLQAPPRRQIRPRAPPRRHDLRLLAHASSPSPSLWLLAIRRGPRAGPAR
ncbi:putative glycerol-3-phosphate transporter 5 [Miscanthus floridulus]|uniref:putative glycerol-3-phosphate transporter 5 n=1 Tax=Miscanthus floridulus TaxID=154761 RepID=UPI0034580ECC